jgi:DNA polymerase III alpha subunit
MTPFVHLSVRSCFSFLEGASRLRELCQATLNQGYDRFGLTDRNGLYGLPAYLSACEHFGLEPVVGALVDEVPAQKKAGKLGDPTRRGAGAGREALLLPTSQDAYAALCQVISARHRQGGRFDLVRALAPAPAELLVLSRDEGLLRGLIKARGPEGLYVELAGGRSPDLEARAERLTLPLVATTPVVFALPAHHTRHCVLRAISLKRTLGRLRPQDAAAPEAYLLSPSEVAERFWGEPGRAAMSLAGDLGQRARFGGLAWGFGRLTFPKWTPPARAATWLPAQSNPSSVRSSVHSWGAEARPGRRVVGATCPVDFGGVRQAEASSSQVEAPRGGPGSGAVSPVDYGGTVLGEERSALGAAADSEEAVVDSEGGAGSQPQESTIQILRRAALAGLRRRYKVPSGVRLPARALARLEVELRLVESKGFADYFLIVRDLVDGFPRTCGRGSAASSLVAYALGITHVDPVQHDLFFERFLNEGREHPPDIDIDFPWDERDDALANAFSLFGERIAMVCNHVCFRPRAALREVGRSFGLPESEISAITKRLPYFSSGPLERTLATHPMLRGVELSSPWDEITQLAAEISGLPRHLSVHPGGVVITPGPIRSLCPVQWAPKGVPILQWEKEGVEQAGLVKIDLLGNRSLAVIRDALEAARGHGFEPPPYEALDVIEDARCIAMLARGETVGCFYVESPAMRQLQRKSRRGDFAHLVIHSSIIRPAANAFIGEYLRRLRGGSWVPLHPGLERTLQGTLGLTAYQEDLARLAIELAGFTPKEGDQLRKVLSRKEEDWRLSDVRERFALGARERGLSEALIGEVWGMMKSFAGYSFCKAHSASYALVSFKCCYLRDRYPAEFLAAVISNGGGFYSTLGYLGEARRLGLQVELACVNRSDWAWIGRGQSLRAGLSRIQGLRLEIAEELVAVRSRGGPFSDFADLVARVPGLLRHELAQLARGGALDALGEAEERAPDRSPALQLGPFSTAALNQASLSEGGLSTPSPSGTQERVRCDGRPSRSRLHWRIALLEQRSGAGELFAGLRPHCPTPPRVGELSADERLAHEIQAYGLPLTLHPLELWYPELAELDVTPAGEIPRHVGRRVRICGWLVTGKLVQTKHRDPMEFILVEDLTGLVDVTVFPQVYARSAACLHAARPLLVSGRVEEEFGVPSLVADRIRSWWGPCRVAEEALAAADCGEEDLLD